MPVTVWSEREQNPLAPGWHDCWLSSGLMVLVAAGFTDFPAGAYTDAEREALERSQTIFPPEVGGNFDAFNQATQRRYGVQLHTIADGSAAGLRAELSKPGRAFDVAGLNANLRSDLRGWDPTFAGNHSVTVIPRGGGLVDWLDPEAPMGSPAVTIDVETVMRWAFIPSDARYLAIGELGATFVDYRVHVAAGQYAFWWIPGGSSVPTRRRLVGFSRSSWAPAGHTVPGYWQVSAGDLRGWYLIAGRSLRPFTAERRMRLPGGAVNSISVDPFHGM